MFLNKQRVKVEKILFPVVYMVLYRTKLGLVLMDRLAKKHSKIIGTLSILGVIAGFIGMIVIIILLANGVYEFLFDGAPPPVAPLFPGIKTVPGVPVISFFHWIIAIFILAVVHEFSHGLVARLHGVNVKSSGFAIFSFIFPVIPAAFVEPDEKELASKKNREQLEVLAAGSFSNMITAGVFLLIFSFILTPAFGSTTYSEGILIVNVQEGSPANLSGVNVGEEVLKVNNVEVENVNDFYTSLNALNPGDKVELATNVTLYSIIAAEPPKSAVNKVMFWKKNNGHHGINISPIESGFKDGFEFIGKVLLWLTVLVFWVFAANLGVGLFNLLPMGPLDGGKMFYLLCLSLFKNESQAKKIWVVVSLFCLALIFISLAPFLWKLLNYIFGIFVGLF